jgi:hypothetical protein
MERHDRSRESASTLPETSAPTIRPVVSQGWTLTLVLGNALTVATALYQLYGVWVWHWDTFQILMLYWMETVIIGVWAVLRVAVLPAAMLGDITVNGRVVPATNRALVLLFGAVFVVWLGGHLLLLWVMFAGPWAQTVHGPASFVAAFVVASGAWGPLLFTLIGGAIGFYESPMRPGIANILHPRFAGQGSARPPAKVDGLGDAIGGVFGRIALLQVALIVGGMLARSYGSMAPWLILIGLKTMVEIRRPPAAAGS